MESTKQAKNWKLTRCLENEPFYLPSCSLFLPRSDRQDQAWLCKFPKPADNIAPPVNKKDSTVMATKQTETLQPTAVDTQHN